MPIKTAKCHATGRTPFDSNIRRLDRTASEATHTRGKGDKSQGHPHPPSRVLRFHRSAQQRPGLLGTVLTRSQHNPGESNHECRRNSVHRDARLQVATDGVGAKIKEVVHCRDRTQPPMKIPSSTSSLKMRRYGSKRINLRGKPTPEAGWYMVNVPRRLRFFQP